MSLSPRIDKLQDNLIINGNFDFWQRGTAPTATINFWADRFRPSTANITTQINQARSADVPFGNGYSLLMTANNTIAPVAGTVCGLIQPIEGFMAHRANGKKIGITYYVKANHSATYSGAVIAGSSLLDTYAWTFETIANQWVRVDQIVDLNGHAINYVSTTGMSILFAELLATSDRLATADTWVTGSPARRGILGQKNFFDTIGNTMQIAKVMVYVLDDYENLVDDETFIYAGRSYAEELLLCQRYYEKSANSDDVPASDSGEITYFPNTNYATTSAIHGPFFFKVTKRGIPTMSFFDSVGTGGSGAAGRVSTLATGGAATNNVAPADLVVRQNFWAFQLGATGAHAGYVVSYAADAEL